MGIESGSGNNEIQNQEINQSNREQVEQNQAEHQRSGNELEGNSTIDNEGERKQIEGKDDAADSEDNESSSLDKEDEIRDDANQGDTQPSERETSEQSQLDNQNTIEADSTGAEDIPDEPANLEESLDDNETIEDDNSLNEGEEANEEDAEDSLDKNDSIENDETNVEDDSSDEPKNSLDDDDSIEDSADDDNAESKSENEESDTESENVEKAENSDMESEDTDEATDSEDADVIEDAESNLENEESEAETENTDNAENSDAEIMDTDEATDSEDGTAIEDAESKSENDESDVESDNTENDESDVESENTDNLENDDVKVEDTDEATDSEDGTAIEDAESKSENEEPDAESENTDNTENDDVKVEDTDEATDSEDGEVIEDAESKSENDESDAETENTDNTENDDVKVENKDEATDSKDDDTVEDAEAKLVDEGAESDVEESEGNEARPEDYIAKESGNEISSDVNDRKAEVSDELKSSLEPFEQSNWDNMPLEQKKEATENLRDSIANDLGLQEKPNIEYYNNDDDSDFGGYSPSENTIYINEHNMGDAKETADTIAHESRHCWQHEMAENSDSAQAQEFKENFDDYIRPEDDYRGYRNQPVESDAREYARDITDNIPKGTKNEIDENLIENINTNPNATDNDIRRNEEGIGAVFDDLSSRPDDIQSKVEDYESKVKAPEDYASKFEYDTQQKLENYYNEDGGKLTSNQKEQLVSELKSSYDNADKSERTDVLVPENAKDVTSVYYNGKTGKYDVGYDWKPVDTVPESRNMEILKEGQQFDRVGPPSGRCTGAVGEDGSCATVKERSIPYHFTEDDITKEPSYHRYEAEQDFTKENLSNAIDNSMYSDEKKAEMHTNLDRYYENAQKKGYGDGDGLASGEIAPMFEDTTGATGGGKQYDMPFSMEELEDIGMISEVPKERY